MADDVSSASAIIWMISTRIDESRSSSPTSFRVPEIYNIERLGAWYMCVSSEIAGLPLESLRAWPSDLTIRLSDSIHEYQEFSREMHDASHDERRLFLPGGSWRGHLLSIGLDKFEPRTIGWRKNLDQRSPAAAVFDNAIAALSTVPIKDRPQRSLLHTDLLHGNVLVQRRPAALGIIDWGSAVLGDPLYEYASLEYWCDEIGRRIRPQLHALVRMLRPSDAEANLHYQIYLLRIALQQVRFNAHKNRVELIDHHARRAKELMGAIQRLCGR